MHTLCWRTTWKKASAISINTICLPAPSLRIPRNRPDLTCFLHPANRPDKAYRPCPDIGPGLLFYEQINLRIDPTGRHCTCNISLLLMFFPNSPSLLHLPLYIRQVRWRYSFTTPSPAPSLYFSCHRSRQFQQKKNQKIFKKVKLTF